MAKKTRSTFVKAFARLWKENEAITTAMIAAGRGHEVPSQTMKNTDELSLRFIANATARLSLRYEVEQTFGPDMVDVLSGEGLRATY